MAAKPEVKIKPTIKVKDELAQAAQQGEQGEEQQQEDDGTVLVNAPRSFMLTIRYGETLRIGLGVQRMPKAIFDHPYVQANGVVLYTPAETVPVKQFSEKDLKPGG
ncbi:MAG: hypothetical protein ACREP9_09855 [Candidatus Dormibacteraceae bacterium]